MNFLCELYMNKFDFISHEIHGQFIWTSHELHMKITIDYYVGQTNFMCGYEYVASYGLHMNEPPGLSYKTPLRLRPHGRTWRAYVRNFCENWTHYNSTALYTACNRPVAQISQCTSPIAHNAPFCYRKFAHVCMFLLQNGALWDIICLMHCAICEMGLLSTCGHYQLSYACCWFVLVYNKTNLSGDPYEGSF